MQENNNNNNLKLSEPFSYENDLKLSLQDSISFFDQIGKKYVYWNKIYDKIYSGNELKPEWFKGGKLNICFNILNLKIKNNKQQHPFNIEQIAIIHECPIRNVCNKITYFELWKQVCQFSSSLRKLGIKKGDGVLIHISNSIQVVIAMLSCSRIGAVHCVVYTGFSITSIASRIECYKPKLLITSSCGLKSNETVYFTPIIEKAMNISNHKIEYVIVHYRNDIITTEEYSNANPKKIENSLNWDDLIKYNGNNEQLDESYEILDSHDPLYLSFTSGTTGQGKGLLTQQGPLSVMINYNIRNIYGVKQGDIYFSSCDIGWALGHILMVYDLLMVGATTVMFDGDTTLPNANNYFNIVLKHNVCAMCLIPTEVKMIKQKDPSGKSISNLNLSSLKSITFIGERLDESVIDYIRMSVGNQITIIDNYGQTEINTCISYPSCQIPFKLNSAGKKIPGYKINVISKDGNLCKQFEKGEIVIKLPLPPNCVNSLYLNPEGYIKNYLEKYPGYYRTGDLGYFDNDGYYCIVSRIDDMVSVYSDRIYCSEIEQIILKHPHVIDCVVIGIKDKIYGERVISLIIFKSEFSDNQLNSIKDELNNKIQELINGLAILKFIIPVTKIPTTKSGKKIRHYLSKIYNECYQVPISISNIDDLKLIEMEIKQFKLQHDDDDDDNDKSLVNLMHISQ